MRISKQSNPPKVYVHIKDHEEAIAKAETRGFFMGAIAMALFAAVAFGVILKVMV